MWEELVRIESGGKLGATDLVWYPDASVAMQAYAESSNAARTCNASSGVSYFRLADSGIDGHLHLVNGSDTLDWISPYCPSLLPPSASTDGKKVLFDATASEILGHSAMPPGSYPTVDVFCWDHLHAGATTQLALALVSAAKIFESGNFPKHVLAAARTDLLAESSKLRALRHLLGHLWALHSDSDPEVSITAITSTVGLSAADAENNMIRNSVAGIAGILGTADFLAIQPWNVFQSGYCDSGAANLSHNLFYLLCDESQLDKIADPLAGSYAIETLTDRLIQSGWDLFLELRTSTPSQVATLLNDRLLPADRLNYAQGGRHQTGKGGRVQIGVTDFTRTGNPILNDGGRVFPLPTTFEFICRIGGHETP